MAIDEKDLSTNKSLNGSLPGWGYGVERISAASLRALTRVRAEASRAIRSFFEDSGHIEVTTATLTQMSGSCENPATMFSVPYYDRTAFLAQSAQLQLEVIVGVLSQPAFTFATSFRAEDYVIDKDSGRKVIAHGFEVRHSNLQSFDLCK